MRSGKISSLPASISKISTHFARGENREKFPVGPTSSRPGPILFKVAATAVKLVVKSYASSPSIRTEPAKIKIYTAIKILWSGQPHEEWVSGPFLFF